MAFDYLMRSIWQENKVKDTQNRKERYKLCLADVIVLYIEDIKKSIKNLD